MQPITMSPVLDSTDTSGEVTLINLLKALQARQAQPVVPDNPLAQLGTMLSGFAAGTQGKPNPVLGQFQSMREQEMAGLTGQAQIAGSLANISNQKATREQSLKGYNLQVYNSMKDDPSLDVRVAALEAGKAAGILPNTLDVRRAALFGGKELESKYDQVLSIIAAGEDPFSPRYGTLFPKEVFGEVVSMGQNAMQTSGPNAVNTLKKKPESAENVAKARYLSLDARPEKLLNDQERLEKDSLRQFLKIETAKQSAYDRVYADLKAQETQLALSEGRPPRSDGAIAIAATEMVKERIGIDSDIEKIIANNPKYKGAAELEKANARLKLRTAFEGEKAGIAARMTELAKGLPAETVTQVNQLRDVGGAIKELYTKFTPQERAKWAGYANLQMNKLQAMASQSQADPRFARFLALIAKAKSYAFAVGGKALSVNEAAVVFGFVPTGEEISSVMFEQKLKLAYENAPIMLRRTIEGLVLPREETMKRIVDEMDQPAPPPVAAPSRMGKVRKFKQVTPGVFQVIEEE